MPVTVDGVRLWGADESTRATEAQLDVTSVPSQGSDETLLVSLESAGRATLTGRATGLRLTGRAGYPADPYAALAQWILEFQSLAAAEQGGGWQLADDERDDTIQAVVEGVSWSTAAGAPHEASWSLDAVRGEGVFVDETRSVDSATPGTTTTLAGHDLGTIDERQTERSLDVEATPIALADESETVIVPQSGIVTEITITGRKAGTQSALRTFDDALRGLSGTQNTVTYQTGFPGTSHQVRVGNVDSTHNAGAPSTLDYGVTLYEGLSL